MMKSPTRSLISRLDVLCGTHLGFFPMASACVCMQVHHGPEYFSRVMRALGHLCMLHFFRDIFYFNLCSSMGAERKLLGQQGIFLVYHCSGIPSGIAFRKSIPIDLTMYVPPTG